MNKSIFDLIEEVTFESINFESICEIEKIDDEEYASFESIATEGLFTKTVDKIKEEKVGGGIKVKFKTSNKLKDKSVFAKVEEAYGAKIPADLKKFIEMFNGCNIIGKNTWEMKNFNEGSTLYILDTEEVDFFKNTVKVNFIPLLNDGFGNYYGVSENGKIGFFNHDSGNVEDVADTWSNFLTNKNL